MPSERILVCGSGVAGSVTAFWLAKYGFKVVVVERSKAEQKAGQGLEIEEPALKVVKAMGIFDKLNDKETGELGFQVVDKKARSYGILEASDKFSPTGALVLIRGDLTEVLYKAADQSPNIIYIFETTVQSLRQTGNKVIVDLQHRTDKSTETEEFDLVIGADGQGSRTRQFAIGSPKELDCLKPVGCYVAYFSIDKETQDWPYSRLYISPSDGSRGCGLLYKTLKIPQYTLSTSLIISPL